MYRALVMFPKSVSAVEVDALIEAMSTAFTASAGFQTITRSAGPLMGPGAQHGEVGCIVEADFASLDDVMAALHADEFQDVKASTEGVGTTIFLFECTPV